MKVLVLCSGAKDHSVAWWFSKSKLIDGLFVAPENPGTEDYAVNLKDLDPSDKDAVLASCKKNGIGFVFIGTEEPLFTGVIDHLNSNGIVTFGAPSYALKLEGDRQFSKEFAQRNGVSIPKYQVFTSEKELVSFLEKHKGEQYAIKPNSISPSRVMVNSSNQETLLSFAREQFEKKDNVVLEESSDNLGISLTITVLLDEKGYLVLPTCSEYTKSEHGEEGRITGGLGAVCPVSVSEQTKVEVFRQIINPTIEGLKKENLLYKGVLTFSVFVNDGNPVLVDYHVRFNDPAAQTFIPLIENDVVELMIAMQKNTLSEVKLKTNNQSAVSVVIASKGYPMNTEVGFPLDPIRENYMNNSLNTKPYLFFGAVKRDEDKIVTTGGRAVTIVGLADNILDANSIAYDTVREIKFKGSWYREDIGNKFFASAAK